MLINLLRDKINHVDFDATKKKLFQNCMRRLWQWLYYWTFLFTDVFKLLGFSYFTIVEHSYRARGIVCRSKIRSRWNHDVKIKLVTICRFGQSLHNLDRLIPKAEWIKSFLDCFLSKPSLCIRYWIFYIIYSSFVAIIFHSHLCMSSILIFIKWSNLFK